LICERDIYFLKKPAYGRSLYGENTLLPGNIIRFLYNNVPIFRLSFFVICNVFLVTWFVRAFLPSGVSPGPITEVLGPDVPALP
jgi:hypothetical protein